MAVARKTTGKKTTSKKEKLSVEERLGQVMLSSVVRRKNSNGNEYIPTPFGAVYARLDEVQPGLYTVVKLSNDAIALNRPTDEERLSFVNSQMEKFPNMTASDICEFYGI